MILNFIRWNVNDEIIPISENFEIRWYSLLFALGFIIGYYILKGIFKKEGLKVELLDKLTIYAVIGTILGARLGHCLFYDFRESMKAPWEIILPFKIEEGNFQFTGFRGLASHGGAIGVFIAMYLFHRKSKLSLIWILDRVSIVTALAGSFIRLGNLFNSEIYGVQTNLPFGFIFIQANETVPKHPTQIYEALSYFIIFLVLLYLYRKYSDKLKPGLLTGWFFILVFTARFIIEFVKEEQAEIKNEMVLKMGQILSIPLIIAGILILVFIGRNKIKTENKQGKE